MSSFPERVGPRNLSLESVDYLGTSEYFSGREKEESLRANLRWWGVGNFHCMQMSLVMVMRFISGYDWNDKPYSSRFCSVISLESRPFDFRVFIRADWNNSETNRPIRYKIKK